MNTSYETFTNKDYRDLLAYFEINKEEKYKKFSAKLEPGSKRKRYGIRTPVIRDIAKRIKKGDFRSFLKIATDDSHEETLLKGMVIAGAKMQAKEKISYIKNYIPLIDCWSLCDMLICELKDCKKVNRRDFFDFATSYMSSDNEFEVRFTAVTYLCHYHDDEYADEALNNLKKINHEGYYAKMGVAWALSQFYIFQKDKTLDVIKKQLFSPWIQNKAIQKIRESFRVSKEDKSLLTNYKY